jgi:iron complex outermembrane receptor protein
MNVSLNRLIFYGAILIFNIFYSFSQSQDFEIAGKILNAENSEPVSNAVIFIPETEQFTTSNKDGDFSLKNLNNNKIRLKITHLTFQEKIIDLSLDNNFPKNLLIYLIPKSINLSPVIVLGNNQVSFLDELSKYSSILSGKELQRNLSQTLASTLKNEAGLSIRSMGPAPSRPVFRGLSQDRIIIGEDGFNTVDLSSTSPDHAVTLEPFQSERIEVLRGPKVLTRSSTSLGGIINVIKNDIPVQIHNQIHFNIGGYYESANKGFLTGIQTEIPIAPFSAKFELSRKKTKDLKTPIGYLNNSYSENFNSNLGLSFFQDWGMIGSSFKIYNLDYGVPGGFVGAHPFGVKIEIEKQQINALSKVKLGNNDLEIRFSNNQFRQKEFEYDGLIGSDFAIITNSGEICFNHSPILLFSEGTSGISFEHRDFNIGGYVFTPPSYSLNISSFIYQNLRFERFNIEVGFRYSYDKINPKREKISSRIGKIEKKIFHNLSISLATIYQLSERVFTGVNFSKSSRVPTIEELYSEGPHLAAYSYEVGNPNLKSETGFGSEFYIYHKFDKLFFNLNIFYYNFDRFIIPQKTGEINYQTFLPIYAHNDARALQYGFDGTLEWKLQENIIFSNSLSYVKGLFKDTKKPLPQIPPLKGEVGLRYYYDGLNLGVFVEWANSQKRVDKFEEETAGYAIVNLFSQYIFQVKNIVNNVSVVIENLFNKEYRNHLSRVKSIMPEAGFNVRVIYRIMI